MPQTNLDSWEKDFEKEFPECPPYCCASTDCDTPPGKYTKVKSFIRSLLASHSAKSKERHEREIDGLREAIERYGESRGYDVSGSLAAFDAKRHAQLARKDEIE